MDVNKAAQNIFIGYVGYKCLKSAFKTPDLPVKESRWEQFSGGFMYPKKALFFTAIAVVVWNVVFAVI